MTSAAYFGQAEVTLYILLKFPETENDKNMISEMKEFKRTHHGFAIFMFDTDNQELADAITDYISRM